MDQNQIIITQGLQHIILQLGFCRFHELPTD